MNVFSMSVRYIRSRKLESALAVVGIVLGVATLAGTLSLISSYEAYYEKFSQTPSARQIQIVQATRVRSTDDAAVLLGTVEAENVQFSAAEAAGALEECPAVGGFFEAQHRSFTTRSGSNQSFFGGNPPAAPGAGAGAGLPVPPDRESGAVADVTVEQPLLETVSGAMVSGGFFDAWQLRAEYGDVLSDASDNSGVPGAVIGADLAAKLYAGITESSALLGKRVLLNNTVYSIIGVLARDEWNSSERNLSFNEMIFVPTYNMRANATGRAVYRSLTYTAASGSTPAQAALQLESYFNSIHGEGAVLAEANLDRFNKEITKRQRILTLMVILASASALTAAINLFNLMSSRVLRRRRPIAIMRSIGASGDKVFHQILLEAALLGMLGSLAGILLSPLVVLFLGTMLENSASGGSIPVSANYLVLVMVSAGAMAVSILFAAIPAYNGSRLVITDALRSE